MEEFHHFIFSPSKHDGPWRCLVGVPGERDDGLDLLFSLNLWIPFFRHLTMLPHGKTNVQSHGELDLPLKVSFAKSFSRIIDVKAVGGRLEVTHVPREL